MRFGVVVLPEARWRDAERVWRRVDEMGFHHAWTYDHLAWRSLRGSPWFGSVPVLTAAAAATSRVRLGPLVASPNFRHPVAFAHELMTLDDVSGGRLMVGLGAGTPDGWDATVLGAPPWSPGERADRFEEFVLLLDRLLTEPEVSFGGTYYAAEEATMQPGCVQDPRPPFVVAATGPRGYELAARHADLWVTTGDRTRRRRPSLDDGVADVAVQMAQLDLACERAGRDPASVGRMVLLGPTLDQGLSSKGEFEEVVGRYAEVGVTDLVVHHPRDSEPYAGDVETFEAIFSAHLA